MNPSNKIINRIQKLLDLAGNNPNEHEQARAMEMAMELLAKYNLDLKDIKRTDETGPVLIKRYDIKCGDLWQKQLLNAACHLYYTSFLIFRQGRKQYASMVGTEENIQVAAEIAKWLINTVRNAAETRYTAERLAFTIGSRVMVHTDLKTLRRSFKLGAAAKILQRANEIRERRDRPNATTGTALMVLRNELEKANQDFIEDQGFGEYKGATPKAEASAYFAGVAYGGTVGLERQIGANTTERIKCTQ